jgi:multiple sugar transport system substrate-binding protein
MKLRYVKFFSLAAALCLVLASCGGKSAASGDANKGEIVFWSWSESETKGLAERFNAVYPDIKIKFVPVDSSNFVTKFQMALMSHSELPDVALLEMDLRGPMFALDCWENLEAAPYNFDRSVVYPQILPTMTNDRDEVIGIERELNPSGLLYNRSLAQRYLGTQDPDEVAALIRDWDRCIALGRQIAQKSNGTVKLFPGMSELTRLFQNQYVEPIFEGQTVNATKFFTAVLTPIIQMNKGNMVGKLNMYEPSWNQSFLGNEYLFYTCAPWTPQWILKPNDPDGAGRWGVTTAPGKGISLGGTAYGIPSAARNKAQAWKFIEWATTTEDGVDACAKIVGAIVSREATYADGFPEEPDPYFSGQRTNTFLMEKAAPTMAIRRVNQYDVILSDVLSLVCTEISNNSGLTLDQAVAKAVAELKNKVPAGTTVL